MKSSSTEVLLAARRIANHAKDEGVLLEAQRSRTTCEHLGAVLADSILQTGLNYKTVVRPRVLTILAIHPHLDRISLLVSLIQDGATGAFLNWNHSEKVNRFESVVFFMQQWGIEDVGDLRTRLLTDEFRNAMQLISGVGPKTVDYMASLVGIESIAIDRHVRAYAKRVGVDRSDYHFLRASFCCAADLLAISRRAFDAWLWNRAALTTTRSVQTAFEV